MGAIEISAIIAIVGCVVGVMGFFAGRDKRITTDAKWRGSVDAKLDLIIGLRTDVDRLDRTLNNHSERLAKVESSAQQAHRRLDELTKK